MGKGAEGRDRGVLLRYFPRNIAPNRKSSVRTASVGADVWTEDLQNTKYNWYKLVPKIRYASIEELILLSATEVAILKRIWNMIHLFLWGPDFTNDSNF